MSRTKRFTTVADGDAKRLFVPVPFDPDAVWGAKPRHLVGGTVNDAKIRGAIEAHGDGHRLVLGAMWRRDCGVNPGEKVRVVLTPEGPQRDDLDADVAAALAASPAAAAFFDGLAQFYRKGYLRWIDGTKRRPDERARRIAEMVTRLEAGQKARP